MTGASTATAVAAYGLRDTPVVLPVRELDPAPWRSVLDNAVSQRITGLLVRALADGAFAATDGQREEALARHESMLGFDLLLERLLLEKIAALEATGIPYRVLKGPSLAHSVYPDPGLRSFRDVDLLVPGGSYDAAIAVLCATGGKPRFVEPRAGFNRRFGKGVCIQMPDQLELDVHRTLVAGPFGLGIDPDDLFAARLCFSLGGSLLEGLDPEMRFVHACIHACLGDNPPRLVPMRDVAQMLLHTPLDSRRVVTLCEQWRCGIVVQRAIELTWRTFGITSCPDLVTWALAYRPGAFERWALSGHLHDRSYPHQAVVGLWAIPGLRAKLAYAQMLLVPTPDYVQAHDGSYVRRARRGFGVLMSLWPTRRRTGTAPP